MKIADILMLLGGLSLFLYGMKMMSEGLEVAAGNKMKKILEKLTTNRFLGITVGALITAIIQSSSATTVMVVGFVNSGLMKLSQAVWVIMGANVGTTITGQLIALDIGKLAPLIAFIGVILVVFLKNKKVNCIGEIIAGLGMLFIGMELMSSAMMPLRDSEQFIHMMTSFKNPLYGILAGAIFTALIQSSSASVGILQTLAASGLIGLSSSVYVLFGQNIGTCITAVLASIGTNKNAKRTTIIHLLFNGLGTLIFVPICMFTPLTDWVISWTPTNSPAQIANMHTLFNIATTLLLIPFGLNLAKLAERILPGDDEPTNKKGLVFVKEHQIGSIAIAISELNKEVAHMLKMAISNVEMSFDALLAGSNKNAQVILDNEEYLDYLNTEITRYMSKISSIDMTEQDADTINSLFKITGDIERIGDHALNIFEYMESLQSKSIILSGDAIQEIESLKTTILDSLNKLLILNSKNRPQFLAEIEKSEALIDELEATFRQNQIERMNANDCSVEACVIYSEILINIERISDHALNIIDASNHSHLSMPL
ncbi:MAG: Na/Pi cotransporter family protein [Cellulosilyticaceae bacterium]